MIHSSTFSKVFQDIFANAPIGIFQSTLEGRYMRVNPALATMYGYQSPEEMMEDLTDIGGRLYTSPTRRREFIQALEEEGGVQNFESEIRIHDGTLLWISEDARIVRDEEGRPLYFEGFVKNVSERHRLQEEVKSFTSFLERRVEMRTQELMLENSRRRLAETTLRDALDKANAAIEAKARFLAGVSHELRTPLNAIIGFSEVITGEMMGPMENLKYKEYAGLINGSGQHLLTLINDILDLSKIEAGGMELNQGVVDLRHLLAECLAMVDIKAREKNIALEHSGAHTPLEVKGDALRLKQIFLNLLSNAIKFTPEGGVVTAASEIRGTRKAVVRVSDTGVGIAPEDIPKVFSEYGQVESGLDHVLEGGTGLGLPISRKLARLHGGELDLESRPGRGTTAILTLPVGL